MKAPALILAAALAAAGCAGAKDAPGKAEFELACQQCHPLTRAIEKKKSRQGWQRTVSAMQKRGARVNDEQARLIVDYLTATHGK